jgi:methyl-accepting chemotaxis protein
MQKPDFAFERIMHIAWKVSLRKFLDGKGSLTLEQAVSHKECDLGKWLYIVDPFVKTTFLWI